MKNKYILLIIVLSIRSFAAIDIIVQGEISVTLDDLDGFAYKIPQDKRAGFFDSSKRLEKTLLTLLNMKHIVKYGQQNNYIEPDKYKINVNNKLIQIFPIDDSINISRDNEYLLVREFLKKQESYIQTQNYIMKQISTEELSELSEEKYFVNKSTYIKEETRDIEIISVIYNESNKTEQYKKAKLIMEDIDFDQKKFVSFQDQNNLKNADIEISTLTEFKYDKNNKIFSDKIFSLTENSIIKEPIDYNQRFIIVYVKNIYRSRQKKYDEVKDTILTQLINKAADRKFNSILISLTQDKIEVNEEVLSTLRTRYLIK